MSRARVMLSTPGGDILLDNRSPAPVGGVNLQLYRPGGVFSMQQFGNENYTDTYVVYYDGTISSNITNCGGGITPARSFLRDAMPVNMKNGEGFDFASNDKSGLLAFYLLGLTGGWDAAARPLLPVEVIGNGPAVNIEGLPEAGNQHQTPAPKEHAGTASGAPRLELRAAAAPRLCGPSADNRLSAEKRQFSQVVIGILMRRCCWPICLALAWLWAPSPGLAGAAASGQSRHHPG